MDDINELELISEVQSRPILYDPTGPPAKMERELAWKEVAGILKADVAHVRKRWRSLRDSFMKEHRIFEGTKKSLRKKKRPWFFYRHLEFLIPYCRPPIELSSRKENTDSDPEYRVKFLKRGRDDFPSVSTRARRSLPIKLSKKTTSESDGLEEVVLDLSENGTLENSLQGFSREETNSQGCGGGMLSLDDRCFCCGSNSQMRSKEERTVDPDEHFLLSLLPSFRRLSPKKSSQAKIKFQQLLHEIEFGENSR